METSSTFVLRTSVHGHAKDVQALCSLYYPEGSFVSVSRDMTAKVFMPSGRSNGFCEGMTFGGHSDFISAVCVLPPSDKFPHGLILTGSNDKTILAFDLESPQPKYKLSGHEDTVCCLAAEKYGTVLSASLDKTARVWLGEKCVLHLKGHEAAVCCVALIPTHGYMLTGSADKTIRLWKAGLTERTFTGHKDCVRDLAVVNPQQFLSCSNDFSVRRWMISGECTALYYSHTGFVYTISCLPNSHGFVTCGEDRTIRVWEGERLVQTIFLPTQSVWTTCVLQNGDIATGNSDGVIRVFTKNPTLVAKVEELADFAESVSKIALPSQIGGMKIDDLPGPEVLVNPGRQGQILTVRCGSYIDLHRWSVMKDCWEKVGDVGALGSTQASSRKVTLQGKAIKYTGPKMLALRKRRKSTDTDSTLSKNWSQLNDKEKMMYSEAAIKANHVGIVNEGLKLLNKKKLENEMITVDNMKQIKQGMHVSWPIDSPSWLEWITGSGVPFARHHSLVTRVFVKTSKIEVISFNGTEKSNALIMREVVNIHPMMVKKAVGRHSYKTLQPYDMYMAIRRAEKYLGTCGPYGSVYDLRKNNCEHAVTFFKTGAAFSLQTGDFHVPE